MAGILSLLLSNPHGSGDSPLKFGQSVGEIRNQDDPYYGTGGPSIPAKLAYLLSGAQMAGEGLQSAREGSLAGDPVRAAGGLGEAALAAVPGMGKAGEALVATAPRLAAMLTAGTVAPMAAEGAFSSSPASAAETSNPLPGLYADRQRLSNQIAQTTKARDIEGRTGKGPHYRDLDAQVQSLTTQLGGLDQMIRHNEDANSPEHQQDLAQRQKQIDDQNAKAELDKPFQERHPYISLGMTAAAPFVAAGTSRFALGKIAQQGKSLLAELLQARQAGDVPAMQEAAARLESWRSTALPKQAASVVIPATFPVDARATGDAIDKYSLPPDSKAQKAAAARLDDPVQYARDAVPALAQGLIYSGLGAKFAPSAPRGDAKAMGGLYGNKDSATLSQILKEGADASASVQGPIGRAQKARQARETAVDSADQRNQQLDSGAELVGEAAGDAPQSSLPSEPPHHSFFQPRDKNNRFSGPPKKPKNDN
jgi:hypothetical protein